MSGRVVIVALCGGADRPLPELDGMTAFEHARTPHLDAVAARGAQASITVIAPDIPPESDSGAMALLGYDPLRYYTGRGVLEGLGIGFLDGKKQGVAFRINFASFDVQRGQLDRRTSRDLTDDELATLVDELRRLVVLPRHPDVEVQITGFGHHRGIVSFTSDRLALSGNVSNTDPGFEKRGAFGVPRRDFATVPEPCRPLDAGEAAQRTASLVEDFVAASRRVLGASEVNRRRRRGGRLPANVLLFRDGSDQVPAVPEFTALFGRTLAIYGQVPAERGLCALIAGTWHESRPGPGQSEPDYYRALAATLGAETAEVVFVHVKGPDEPGHDGLPLDKVRAIEAIDAWLIGDLVKGLGPDDRLVVTCDHATPCAVKIHAPDPVPLLLAGAAVDADGGTRFTERQAARGTLPLACAAELMPYLAGVGR
jgi:2,3-bisphosphoglycerate-independent phosphoglycerate mutase